MEFYPDRAVQPYPPLRDYALIGDGHGAALVCRDGSIDWCCLGRFDAPPVFARLLDAGRGGLFSVAPVGRFRSSRNYIADTAILATHFADGGGHATVIDFMPMGCRPGARRHDYADVNAPGWIVRIVRGVGGRVRLRVDYHPTAGFRGAASGLGVSDRVVSGVGIPALHGTIAFSVEDGRATTEFDIAAGEAHAFILAPAPIAGCDVLAVATRMLETTEAYWREWLGYCDYDGRQAAAVRRSAITLKLLIYAPTGALVAAPTTSVPEALGKGRNWDYRFCWIRDGCFALYALAALGFVGEARRFVEFLKSCHLENGLQIMYGVGGETDLAERTIDDFAGYRDSRPVRIGNAAHRQLQLDVYGEVLDLALLHTALGGDIDREERRELARVADLAAEQWREPDSGIWEMRGERRHFVHSKIMCWVAVDRAIRLFGSKERWATARRDIQEAVLRDGTDAETGGLKQAFHRRGADVALLMAPWLAFPASECTLRRTVHAATTELREGDYLRRYVVSDGLAGDEGAFLVGSFWLADALLFLGEADSAEELLEALVGTANDVGLFSEEVEPRNGAFLGNMPQAIVHLALIHSAVRQALYRRGGRAAIAGTHADRARRHIERASGRGALVTAIRQSLRVRRMTRSTRSVLYMP